MTLDIIVFVIFLLCAILGYRRGFIRTLSHTLGWIAAIVCAAFMASPVQSFVKDKTLITEYFSQKIAEELTVNTNGFLATLSGISDVLASGAKDVRGKAISAASDTMADVCVLIAAFLAIFIVVKLVIFFVTRAIYKHNRRTIIGFADRLLGMIIGAATGVLLAFVIGTFLLPVTGIVAPAMADKMQAAVDESIIVKTIYEMNIIGLFLPSNIADMSGGMK